ncbi:hypothetical protein [Faecalispora anaeroviscerum]|uniref:hypothetical protein n=1 Tax=Faecalispora anaeroviscerum TaxID=2991836 RepID=UPI0024BB3549|nr:hypothetical protein [Faecalispora anaeroviscerum]
MFAVNTYEQIEKMERELGEQHIIILLFVRPSLQGAKEIIDEFDYIHYNSEKLCSIYAVGYTNDLDLAKTNGYGKLDRKYGADWYFSDKAFVEFKNNLESRLNWKYSGEIELIVLQSNPNGNQILNFQNYVAIDVNYGIRNEYIDSFPRLMESLIRSSRSEVTATEAMRKMGHSRISVKNVVLNTIKECKKVPIPVKNIVKDRLFYLVSTHNLND